MTNALRGSIVDREGLHQSTNPGQLDGWCDATIAGDPSTAHPATGP